VRKIICEVIDGGDRGGAERAPDDRERAVVLCFLKSLTQQRERPFRGGRNGVIQINAAARLSPKEFAQ
jgi:hypothetical protein